MNICIYTWIRYGGVYGVADKLKKNIEDLENVQKIALRIC